MLFYINPLPYSSVMVVIVFTALFVMLHSTWIQLATGLLHIYESSAMKGLSCCFVIVVQSDSFWFDVAVDRTQFVGAFQRATNYVTNSFQTRHFCG